MMFVCISQDITKKERGADNDSGEEDGTSVSVVCVRVCMLQWRDEYIMALFVP